MKKLLSFLVMALCFVACQNELTMGVSNADLVDVVLNLEAPELGVTRLDGDDQKGGNSAFGGIDFMSDANWEAYDLRYTLEVYGKDKNGVEKLAGQRMVNCLDKYAPTSFELRLAPNRDYKFVVFADYVAEGSAEAEDKLAIADLYYTTADLSNIACKTGAGWVPMNEVRDAYFVSKTLKVENSLNETLTLTRPFGKLRVITTDIDKIDGYATPARVEIQYTDAVYKSFNALSGNLNDEMMSGDELKYNYNIGKTIPYNAGYDAKATHQTLFADYLLAKEGEQIPVNFTMAVYDDGNRLIHTKDFNTQIPVQRNYLTTIIGDLLTTQAEVNIVINDNFIDEFVNATMTPALPAPKAKGEPKVDGNEITIEWEAVEGAGNYSVLVNNEIPVFVEGTTYTFTGEYETAYTIQVTAIPADETAYTHSAATVFTVTTGEEPAFEPVASDWALVGSFSEWKDQAMLTTPDENVVVLEEVALKAAEGFLVRKPSTEWADKYGAGSVNYIKANHYITTAKDGADMCVEADGTYDIYFNTSTKNLYVMEADANYAEATEQTVNGEEPKQEEPEVTEKVVYLKPNANWKTDNARFAAYFWNDGGNVWVSMTSVEDGIYKVNLPEGYDYGCNIIFCRMNPSTTANNWNNKYNQTADLKTPTDGKNLYTVKEGTWDNGGGDWSVYAPAVVEPTEPVALATPEVKAEVEGNVVTLTWDDVENAAQYGITVGTEMPVFVEETTYVFTGEYETDYTFNVVAVPADEEKFAVSEAAVVTVKTEAEPVVEPTYTTVAEFLAAPVDANVEYTLKGTITRVVNTSYGNFDLTDETGTVYIYGLCSPDGATQKYWATSGAKLGDDIVIKTVRADYNGSAQGSNAKFVELLPGTLAFYTVDPAAVDFLSTGGEMDIEVFAYNTDAAVTATSDNDAFAVAVNGYVVTVTAEANELEEKVNGNISIKVGDLEPTIVKATLAAKPTSGTVEGGKDDFDTKSANTSYTTGTTAAGWKYTNCALLNKSTVTAITDGSIGVTMNGKTSAVGSIESPVITTGCGTLKFNYAHGYKESNGFDFNVQIIQNGEIVNTFNVKNTSTTQNKMYQFEENINLSGEFSIKFTNNSPSKNSSSNKDRYTIWDVEWTGYTE